VKTLTPYDTGARLEPVPWVNPKARTAGKEEVRPAEEDDWGKVDFENDESATEVIIWVAPMHQGDDGQIINVERMGEQPLIIVVDGVVVYSGDDPESDMADADG
jgi:hypothetical protein